MANRRGTTRNYKKRGQHISYTRFAGFHQPLQQPGLPSGVCIAKNKGGESCRCGAHNVAWKTAEAKRLAAEREARRQAEADLIEDEGEPVLAPEAELVLA